MYRAESNKPKNKLTVCLWFLQETLSEKRRIANSASEQVKELQAQLAEERTMIASLQAQVQVKQSGYLIFIVS